MGFSTLHLNANLLKALAEGNFTTPTPIQAQTIPAILQGKDAMACAQTGSGKTAAFVLPALHKILSGPSQKRGHGPRVLILTPTRELAQQITDTTRLFTKHARISSGVVIGGVSYGPQFRLLANPLDMLIATPGRLIDHLQERKVDFNRVEMLVLDEADRMLDMGFLKPVEKIIAALPAKPQILLFSATFSPEIEKVAARILQQPHRVQLAQTRQNHADITQHHYHVDNTEHKQAVLNHILKQPEVTQTIIFTATKRNADRLAETLEKKGFAAGALHGDMKQNARKRTLQALHNNQLKVLVATDVAARGIDVKNISHVVNYDLPNLPEDYTHRIGRTGRAGASGVAISLISPPDLPVLRDIEKRLGKPFVFQSIKGLESTFSEADFRKIIPTELPPGRPKQGGQRRGGGSNYSGGPRGNFSGQRSGRAPNHGKGAGFGGGNRSFGGGRPQAPRRSSTSR
ncbi:MAG: DEAD/DEAH box helicase [Proteobacteria bacterium]|nr:DEAD/DEAH box helicase [Pseudomonadota bacterium]NBX86008.1 DEAD/DEAH box helicase [Pseudomonadota bacterium]